MVSINLYELVYRYPSALTPTSIWDEVATICNTAVSDYYTWVLVSEEVCVKANRATTRACRLIRDEIERNCHT